MLEPVQPPAGKHLPFAVRASAVAALGALFFAVYGGCNTFTAWRAAHGENIPTWAFAWEQRIPLLPWTAVPYWSEDLFFVLAIRRDDDPNRAPDYFLCAVTKHLLRGGIPRGDDAAQILADDRVVGGLNDRGQKRFGGCGGMGQRSAGF